MVLEEVHLIGYFYFYPIDLNGWYVMVIFLTLNILSGVPQGSVLGPLLFLVYTNDITDYVSSLCRLFADDCILYQKNNSPADINILQNDLKELEN